MQMVREVPQGPASCIGGTAKARAPRQEHHVQGVRTCKEAHAPAVNGETQTVRRWVHRVGARMYRILQTTVWTMAFILLEPGSHWTVLVSTCLALCKKFRVQKGLNIRPLLNIAGGQWNKITPKLYGKYVKKLIKVFQGREVRANSSSGASQ